jgi:hypothetical protein
LGAPFAVVSYVASCAPNTIAYRRLRVRLAFHTRERP